MIEAITRRPTLDANLMRRFPCSSVLPTTTTIVVGEKLISQNVVSYLSALISVSADMGVGGSVPYASCDSQLEPLISLRSISVLPGAALLRTYLPPVGKKTEARGLARVKN